MKKNFYLLIFFTLAASFGACNKSSNVDEAWRDANINAYDAITKNKNYHVLPTPSGGPNGVYCKVDSIGKGTEYPLQTSTVKVLYKGTFYDGSVFDNGSSLNGIPVEFSVASTVRGFSFALQNMVVGDHWEIWVPYYLGYGSVGQYDSYGQQLIKGYTTLVFDVELVSITRYP